MELAAIHLARAMAFIEPIDLNPKGKVFYPDLVKLIVNRYKFEKFPQKLEDFNESNGIVFEAGKTNDCVVEKLIIYAYGILIDTRVSTQKSKEILEDALKWASNETGLSYRPIDRWQYASQITFYSDFALTRIHPAVQRLAEEISKNVSEMVHETLKYELNVFAVDHDQLERKHPIGRFSIQRRENTPFFENKYFSDAPLQTDIHIKLLEQFEAGISTKS